jgi:hypothetical protein
MTINPEEPRMRLVVIGLAALSLAALSACGGTTSAAEPAAAAPAASVKSDEELNAERLRYENLVADCMKKAGFTYKPDTRDLAVRDPSDEFNGLKTTLLAEDQVRAYREKYGFGKYSQNVYPGDPKVTVHQPEFGNSPNAAAYDALDAAQQKAWDFALVGPEEKKGGTKAPADNTSCSAVASKEVYGDKEQSPDAAKAAEREWRAFQTDADVVAAADKYASCLTGKGYKPKVTTPGDIETQLYWAQQDKWYADTAKTNPATAKAELDKEIEMALADLDCRKDYAGLLRTKWAKVITNGPAWGLPAPSPSPSRWPWPPASRAGRSAPPSSRRPTPRRPASPRPPR